MRHGLYNGLYVWLHTIKQSREQSIYTRIQCTVVQSNTPMALYCIQLLFVCGREKFTVRFVKTHDKSSICMCGPRFVGGRVYVVYVRVPCFMLLLLLVLSVFFYLVDGTQAIVKDMDGRRICHTRVQRYDIRYADEHVLYLCEMAMWELHSVRAVHVLRVNTEVD